MSSKIQDVNMNINCLKITFADNEIAICKLFQKIDHVTDVATLINNEYPVVYLFDNEHLDVLRQHVDVVDDRGSKHPSKSLVRYLLPRKKVLGIPILETHYQSERKAIYAVNLAPA